MQPLVAHLEHLTARIAQPAGRLDAFQGDDAAARTLLATVSGFGPETVRT